MTNIIGAPTLDDALVALREWVQKNEDRGERSFIFCEDRMTLLAERSILEQLGGTFLSEVCTFARFLSGSAQVLSKQGSVMQLTSLLTKHREQLTCFRENSAGLVYDTIAQLSASRVNAEMLRESALETDGILQRKLNDLAFLLEKYQEFLAERNLVDESGYLSLLPQKIAQDLRDANVCFFAFPSFTRQAQEGVRSALENAQSVTGIFLAGREELYTNEGAKIFRKLAEEYGEAHSRMLKPSLNEVALAVRAGIFSPDTFSRTPLETDKICVFSAEDSEAELETVASLIKKHVAEGMRYRDMALLVASEDAFSTVEKVFHAYFIPFFCDKKRAFSTHPFMNFALSVLSATADGALPQDVDGIAASVYFPNGERYRNYLLKFGGYRGAVKREIKEGEAVKEYDRNELVACRERMLGILSLFSRKGKCRAFCEGVRQLYALVEGEKITQALADGFLGGVEEQFLSMDPLWKILDEMTAILGEETVTAREFSSMLLSGADANEVSTIPQYSDAIFVGDATESRFARVKVLFVTGLTNALPRATADTAVISDSEIDRLSALQVEIEPAIAQVNARAREGLALNLCAFSEYLYASYPLQEGTDETYKSEVVAYLNAIATTQKLPALFPYDACERQPAFLKLLSLRSQFEGGKITERKEYDSLYASLCQLGEGEQVDELLTGGKKENVSCGEKLYFANGSVSPTLLEQYFACPYAGFLSRGLRLREREETTALDTDTGTFVHTVLEEVAKSLNVIKSEEECTAIATQIATTLVSTPRFAPLVDTKAGEYTAERLIEESAHVATVMYQQLTMSAFTVRSTEEKVTMPELSLYGKADRVDESGEYVRIIDYKTGKIDDSPTSYYTGRKLQLQLYLKSIAGASVPSGAFYFPASDAFTKSVEEKFVMLGFYNADRASVEKLDKTLGEGEQSSIFKGGMKGSKNGMGSEDFRRFLDYATLVSAKAEGEMKEGHIAPSPYEGACLYCKYHGMCAFDGEPRKEPSVACDDIVRIVKTETGEE